MRTRLLGREEDTPSVLGRSTLRQSAGECEQAETVMQVPLVRWVLVRQELPHIVDDREVKHSEAVEHRKHVIDLVYSVPIELGARHSADRERHVQRTIGGEDPRQLGRGLFGATRVESVTVPAEADVLDDMEAAEGRQRAVGKRKG